MASRSVVVLLGIAVILVIVVGLLASGVLNRELQPSERGVAGEATGTLTQATGTTASQKPGQGGAIYNVKIGILRVVEAVPFIVAANESLFSKYGINASIEIYGSAKDRDSAIVSGLIDVSLNNPVSTLIMADKGVSLKIVALLLGQYPEDQPISILLPPGSSGNITCIDEVAVAKNTLLEFAAWKLLESLGCDPGSVKWVDVPSILNRFQLLIEGKIKAAVMIEPWDVLAVSKGARILATTANLNESIVMTVVTVKSDLATPDFIKRIRSALNEALELYKANPEKYRDLIERSISIPEDLKGRWLPEIRGSIGDYPENNFDLVASWLLARGLISKKPSYSDIVVNID